MKCETFWKRQDKLGKIVRITTVCVFTIILMLCGLAIAYKVVVVDAVPVKLNSNYTVEYLETLKTVECLNCNDTLAKAVGFDDYKANPYPPNGYDTVINKDVNCYAHVKSKQQYELLQLNPIEAKSMNASLNNALYITHRFQCGVCSTLQDLAAYLLMI
jgi:hypothetical protein